MKAAGRVILIPILLAIFTFIFFVLDNGLEAYQFNQLIQPAIFAVSLVACIFSVNFRRYTIIISLILLLLMIITYLFNDLNSSNRMGSLGFGMLFIAIFSYIPELIKNGKLEKF